MRILRNTRSAFEIDVFQPLDEHPALDLGSAGRTVERYFMYFEESKAALDMHRAGWRVVVDPNVEIRHREGGSTRHAPFRKVRNHHRSALRFSCDYNRRSPWLALAPLVAVGSVLRGAVSVLRTAVAQRRRITGRRR